MPKAQNGQCYVCHTSKWQTIWQHLAAKVKPHTIDETNPMDIIDKAW